MLRSILPDSVVVVETRDDRPCALHPAEVGYLTTVREARAREFTTVRRCAELALAALGLERGVMTPGAGGSPQWPPGVLGSMTHCPGYRAACVTRSGSDVLGVGIDVESTATWDVALTDAITSPSENLRVQGMAGGAQWWAPVLFSAKESCYKASYPAFGEFWEYCDIDITVFEEGTFIGRVVNRSIGSGVSTPDLCGRWVRSEEFVFTSAILRMRRWISGC